MTYSFITLPPSIQETQIKQMDNKSACFQPANGGDEGAAV